MDVAPNQSDLVVVACPRCKNNITLAGTNSFRCVECRQVYPLIDGIPNLVDITSLRSPSALQEFQNNRSRFEQQHNTQDEPWNYSQRAAEILKRRHILLETTRHSPSPRYILDIGCSLGQLSRMYPVHSSHYFAIDISPSAVRKADSWWRASGSTPRPSFFIASATALPFRRESLDIIFCMDGLYGMDMTEELQKQVLRECYEALRAGGTIIFTDYMRPGRFPELIRRITESSFCIVHVHYLYDRLWYQMESWFQRVAGLRLVSMLLQSTALARLLSLPARLFGRYGSKHICIVAKKNL